MFIIVAGKLRMRTSQSTDVSYAINQQSPTFKAKKYWPKKNLLNNEIGGRKKQQNQTIVGIKRNYILMLTVGNHLF